jgi:hypothetical protein
MGAGCAGMAGAVGFLSGVILGDTSRFLVKKPQLSADFSPIFTADWPHGTPSKPHDTPSQLGVSAGIISIP